jgi:hypothetical protein
VNASPDEDDVDEDNADADENDTLNLRGILKAACMELRLPIQILWPRSLAFFSPWDADCRIVGREK